MSETILIVDDAEDIRNLVRNVVSYRYEVVGEARNGKEAIEKFKTLDPDIIVLDVKMPKMDGFEALSKIKDIDPDQKIIFYTVVDPSEAENQEEIEEKADAYLVKPCKKTHLLNAIEDVSAETLDSKLG